MCRVVLGGGQGSGVDFDSTNIKNLTILYLARDFSGNTGRVDRNLSLTDTTAPIITLVGPSFTAANPAVRGVRP